MNQTPDHAAILNGTSKNGEHRMEFDTLNEGAGEGADVRLDMILDVPVTLAMEVGRTRISIRNLLQLNQGSVVELDRAAGEPLDVFVNGTLVAHGEVVVINEKFGIRLTDVISPAERVRKLR
jgi:flagellar motor switch protein FliN/FliY